MVTIAKRGEPSLVSHIPAKSSQGAANRRPKGPSPRRHGNESPATTTPRAAAMSPYIGTCTWVSWISRLVSTVWTSGPAKSAIDMGRWTTIVVSGGIAIDISGPAYVAATLWGVNPAYRATIAAPNT